MRSGGVQLSTSTSLFALKASWVVNAESASPINRTRAPRMIILLLNVIPIDFLQKLSRPLDFYLSLHAKAPHILRFWFNVFGAGSKPKEYKPLLDHTFLLSGEEDEMAAWRLITIRPNLYSRLEHSVVCAKCGQQLSLGDEAWAHLCPRKKETYTHYYCLLCFSRLWI